MYRSFLVVIIVPFLVSCSLLQDHGESTPTKPEQAAPEVHLQAPTIGVASFYGRKFKGRKTASGERYNPNAFTAAHPSLPFGTLLLVTNLSNDKTVPVRVNDRGPFVHGRIIDLSSAAARALQIGEKGVVRVKLEVIKPVETSAH